jgi:putative spermidine/putrescine transport system ATP-binding protein
MLEVRDLRIEYQKGISTLDRYNLKVEEGELVSLLGPSGCGKTTTLRAVAGFIEPSAGNIMINGHDVTYLPPNKRDMGLVFQSYALFPHMTVSQNVAFGLKMRGVQGADISKRVDEALQMVDLETLGSRRPAQLSGGQQQRVALARAMVIEPQLLLLDEPLSNLDAKLRVSMRTEIRRLQLQLGVTTLYVTHDQVEAMAISDRVIVMNEGRIEQSGTPESIYSTPDTGFVADFMGFDNHFTAIIETVHDDTVGIQVSEHVIQVPKDRVKLDTVSLKQPTEVFFRSSAANLASISQNNALPGTILFQTFQGNNIEYIVDTPLGELTIRMEESAPRFANGAIFVELNVQNLLVLPIEQSLES